MQTEWLHDSPSASMTAELLLQRLEPSESRRLLHESLGHDAILLEESFGASQLSHAQACHCLVALNGLQVLRKKEIRAAIVRSAHDDQVKACFSQLLEQKQSIKKVADFSLSYMRDEIANRSWQSGSSWSRLFCETLELPGWLSGREIDTIGIRTRRSVRSFHFTTFTIFSRTCVVSSNRSSKIPNRAELWWLCRPAPGKRDSSSTPL